MDLKHVELESLGKNQSSNAQGIMQKYFFADVVYLDWRLLFKPTYSEEQWFALNSTNVVLLSLFLSIMSTVVVIFRLDLFICLQPLY